MKTLKKLLATTVKLVVFIGLVGGGVYAYQLYNAEAVDEDLGEILTVAAEIRDVTLSVSATGILRPVKIIEIKSKASGEILDMPVESGDYLDAGDLIAQIDTRILDQELKQAEADHESAEIRRQIAERQYERARSLRAEDLISENDLETSKQNFSNAESQFIRAEASLELARERLQDTTVTAPIRGRVLTKTVEQGQIIASSTNNVSGGTVLITMADLSELEIRTLVDEIDVGRVSPGLRVESTVEAFADMSFEGEVMKIEPQAEVQQSVTTFPVLSRIDNGEGLLLPGMNADVTIIISERHDVLAVPNEALRSPEDAREVVRLLDLDQPVVAVRPIARTSTNDPAAGTRALPVNTEAAVNGHADNGDGYNGNGNGDNGHRDPTNGSKRTAPEPSTAGASDERDDARRETAVVFLLGPDEQLIAREIVIGVRDWETAEVISGLVEGDELVLLPSNSILRSQERMRERYARRSNVIPAAGR